jgi:hypothetical protein
VTVESSQASPCARVPELDLVVLRPRDNQTLGRVPVAGLDIPVMSGQSGVSGSGGEIKDLECGIVRRRQELGIAGCP